MYQVIEFYLQNLRLARESSDLSGELSALNSLGRAYQALAENEKAADCFELALKIARNIGDGRGERVSLKNLNDLLSSTQKPEKSKKQSTKARRKKGSKADSGKSAGEQTFPSAPDEKQ